MLLISFLATQDSSSMSLLKVNKRNCAAIQNLITSLK